MRALKAFADLVWTTSLDCVHEKMGRIFRLQLQRSLDQIHVRQNGTLTEPECNHCNGSQFRSARIESIERHFGMLCAFSCCRSNEVLRRTYGKDNRVLHTAKLSQGFKVVSPRNRTSATLLDDGNFSLLAAFEVAVSPGKSAEKELLGQACANPFGGADRKISTSVLYLVNFHFFPAFASLDCRIHVTPLFPPPLRLGDQSVTFVNSNRRV